MICYQRAFNQLYSIRNSSKNSKKTYSIRVDQWVQRTVHMGQHYGSPENKKIHYQKLWSISRRHKSFSSLDNENIFFKVLFYIQRGDRPNIDVKKELGSVDQVERVPAAHESHHQDQQNPDQLPPRIDPTLALGGPKIV